MAERFYGPFTDLFTRTSPSRCPRILSFTGEHLHFIGSSAPDQNFSGPGGREKENSEILLRSSLAIYFDVEEKKGRKHTHRRRGSQSIPMHITRMFICLTEIAHGYDVRDARHDFIVHILPRTGIWNATNLAAARRLRSAVSKFYGYPTMCLVARAYEAHRHCGYKINTTRCIRHTRDTYAHTFSQRVLRRRFSGCPCLILQFYRFTFKRIIAMFV